MNTLHHKILGSGPPVVILHGLFGMLDNWFSFAKAWQDQYTIILVDQRNHGRSFHANQMDYALMAQDLHHLLVELGQEEVMVVGHSMGGKTAMQFALSYPDYVSKLAILDIAPKVYRGDHNEIFAAMKALDLTAHHSRTELREALVAQLGQPATADMLLKNIARSSDGFSWRFGLEEIHLAYENLRAKPDGAQPFPKPTLFVRGGKSPYIKDGDEEEIKRLFPNAQLQILPDSGHWVHIDAAEELGKMLDSFFAR